jgi:hypothetical protein
VGGDAGAGTDAAAFGIIWAGLLLATGMITNIGFRTVADLQATDAARAETVWVGPSPSSTVGQVRLNGG